MEENLGNERRYATVFGEREIAIGEHIVARERGDKGTVNGDQLIVRAHLPGQSLECVRVLDGIAVVWNAVRQPASTMRTA